MILNDLAKALPTKHTNHAKKNQGIREKHFASIRVFRGPFLLAGVIGNGFCDVERGGFSALATASPSNGGHVVGNQVA